MRFDTLGNVFVLASQGLDASVPEILKGALAYSPSKQTVTGTFDKARRLVAFFDRRISYARTMTCVVVTFGHKTTIRLFLQKSEGFILFLSRI